MIKFNTFITTIFFILFFFNFCYSDTNKEIDIQNYYQFIKNIPVSFGKIFKTNISKEEKPDIIIINDLHSNSFAQKNIYSIINYI